MPTKKSTARKSTASKAKPGAKKRTTTVKTPKRASPASKPAPKLPPHAGLRTHYEHTTWGMSPAEIATLYPVKFRLGKRFADVRRSINDVPVEVTFQFEDGGLKHVSIAVLRTYAEWGDGDSDVSAIHTWISSQAGKPTESGSAGAKWILPTVKIWTYCDERLGAYFEQPPAT